MNSNLQKVDTVKVNPYEMITKEEDRVIETENSAIKDATDESIVSIDESPQTTTDEVIPKDYTDKSNLLVVNDLDKSPKPKVTQPGTKSKVLDDNNKVSGTVHTIKKTVFYRLLCEPSWASLRGPGAKLCSHTL